MMIVTNRRTSTEGTAVPNTNTADCIIVTSGGILYVTHSPAQPPVTYNDFKPVFNLLRWPKLINRPGPGGRHSGNKPTHSWDGYQSTVNKHHRQPDWRAIRIVCSGRRRLCR